MPPQGIPQRLKQLAQGFLGVNLRKDRVSLADEELAKAINADLHERPGTLLLRRGRRKQFGTALTDLAIRRLALVNGVRYQIAGQSIYRDTAAILSGGLSPNLFTTMQAARPLTDRTTWVFIADDAAMYKDDGTRLVPWGGETPEAPVVAVGGVGTGLTGDYLGGYTYIRFDDVDADDDPAVAHESNVAADEAVTLANNALAIGDIRDPTDSQVNGIGVYRSVIDGALLLLDSREEIPDESTTFAVTHGWEVTASPGGTAADGLQHHWSVDKETKRGTQAWEPVAAPGLRFIGSAAANAASMTLPAHETGDLLIMFAYRSGSTTPPPVPSGWSTWGTGSGANLNASTGGYKVATSDAETSGDWTAATGLICHVYRGQRVAGAIGAVGDTGGSGTTVTYPALSLTDTAGTSLVVTFAGHRAINTRLETAPNGTTLRTNLVGKAAQGEVAGHDTGAVSTWLAKAVPIGGSGSGWRARSLELRAEPTTSDTAGSSEDANGYRGTHLWESVLTIPVTFVSNTNLVTNGTFDTDLTGWSSVAGGAVAWTVQSRMAVVYSGGQAWAEQAVTTVVGTTYMLTVILFVVAGTITIHIGTASQGDQITSVAPTVNGSHSVMFTATTTTTYIGISADVDFSSVAVDDVTVLEVTSGTPTIPVTTQTKRWAYASIIADSALGAEGPNDHDAPPLASWVTEFQGHLVLVRIKDNPHHLRWSRRFAPEAWSPENFLEIGNPDDPLQCALPIAGILGVFSRHTKYRVVGNATSGFVAQEALSRRGTPAALATLATEYGIVFPHHDGIFRTDLLSQDEELSSDIAPLFYGETVNDMAPINWAAAQTFAAEYRKGRYYFAYASGDATTPDTMAVLSRTTNKWYFFDHPARSLYREEGDDEALVAGFADGFVYIIEEGDSDAGSDIALDCETKDYYGGEPDVRKLFLFARVDADIPSGATLSVDLYVDDTLKRTASVTGSRTRVLLPFPEGSMGYTWRLGFRYTGQQRVRISGATVIMLPLEAS